MTVTLIDAYAPTKTKPPRSVVPCNGCTACCQNDLLLLHPECGDDPDEYETMIVTHPLTGMPVHALKQKTDGGCVYLGPGGCTIWDRAPAICREFDCRRFYQSLPRTERRQLVRKGMISKSVLDAGRKRLASLEHEE